MESRNGRLKHSLPPFQDNLGEQLERWRLQKLLRYCTSAIVISASVQIGMLP
jgi:hypothetical protein